MNEEELRALVRQAIQRHMGGGTSPAASSAPAAAPEGRVLSFAQYRLERAADDTMCIIEPAVTCNHCGFCKCHGH